MQIFPTLGIGSSKHDPLYGLLDLDQNFFYMVDYRESVISEVGQILNHSKAVRVINIQDCANWHYNKIDNSVCVKFGVNFFDSKDFLLALKFGKMELIDKFDSVDPGTMIVVNNLPYVSAVITQMQQTDQKFQFDSTDKVLLTFAKDTWLQQSRDRELEYFDDLKQQWTRARQTVSDILNQHDIASETYQTMVNQNIKKFVTDHAPHFMPLYQLYA